MSTIVKSVKEVNIELVMKHHERKSRKPRARPLARPESYLSRMLHASKKVPIPLDAPLDEITEAINNLELRPATGFEVRRAVNEVRNALKLPLLDNPRPERDDEVTYIPLDTFQLKLERLPKEYALYLGSLYATGCRFGELPVAKVKDDWVYVAQQVRDDGRLWRTKNGRKRHAAILPPLKPLIMAYTALPEDMRASLRTDHYYKLYGACTRLYGVSIHTLRHSYAIECAHLGKSVEEIASYIGDTVEVAKKHYLGYIKPTKGPWGP